MSCVTITIRVMYLLPEQLRVDVRLCVGSLRFWNSSESDLTGQCGSLANDGSLQARYQALPASEKTLLRPQSRKQNCVPPVASVSQTTAS